MKTACLAATIVWCSFAWSQNTQTIPVTVFDTQVVRQAGKPTLVSNTFSVPSMVHGPFTINVSNGDRTGENRVSSARINLNGNEVLDPSDFNQNVANLELPVNLQAMNTLTVELASKPGSLIEVSLAGLVDSDQTENSVTATIDSSGGTITFGNVAQLFVPPGALQAPTSVQISSISSPLMDFLAPDLGASFTALDLPKIRIQSSALFALPLRLQILLANPSLPIPDGNQPQFVALSADSGADEESGDLLVPIGGDSCGDGSFACVTLLPDLFMQTNPAAPNDPVLQVAIGFQPIPQSSLQLWQVDQVQPSPGSVN